jgi:hypothetical protein
MRSTLPIAPESHLYADLGIVRCELLNTAKALGLTFSITLLGRADSLLRCSDVCLGSKARITAPQHRCPLCPNEQKSAQ